MEMIVKEIRGGSAPDASCVEYADGRRVSTRVVNLRALGCPDWLATKVEEHRAQAQLEKTSGTDRVRLEDLKVL
jgi:hypothetical protein